jgi:predicted MFS family arabinose efflux permease
MMFFLLGFYVGNWTIRIPDIKAQVNTSYTGMGLNFMALAAGAVIMMVISSWVTRRLTTWGAIFYSAWFIAAGFIGIPFANNLTVLVLLSFGTGLAIGLTEVAMNAQASNLELSHGRSMMSGFHAFSSLGILLGALCTSAAVELGISLTVNFIGVPLVLWPLTWLFSHHLIDDRTDAQSAIQQSIFFRWPAVIFLFVFIAMTSSLLEGAVDSWAALYMQDIVAVSGFKVGLGAIIFNVFMVAGRLPGDRIRDALGVQRFLVAQIFSALVACYILFGYAELWSSIVGFALAGLGVSNLVPVAYSEAGKNTEIETPVAVAIISIFSYGAFMVAPGLEGMIADRFGLPAIFLPLLALLSVALIMTYLFGASRLGEHSS